jgi:hypothetical protein
MNQQQVVMSLVPVKLVQAREHQVVKCAKAALSVVLVSWPKAIASLASSRDETV